MEVKGGIVPTKFIEAESLPEAHYKAIEAVWKDGATKRTQYDLKDSQGNYLHPPGKDAQVLIKIKNPFTQPRFPPLSFCERGKYILEVLGAKNHHVLSRDEILEGIKNGNLSSKWPYTYNQRLTASPTADGKLINQVDNLVSRLVDDLNTRRAVMTTRVPEIDVQLREDIPCLGEIHLRCFEDENGEYKLNMTTIWRSRDLFKAWPDNVIGITYFGRKIASRLERETGKKVSMGGYTDFSNSLHIYGQDFTQVQGEEESGKKGFFEVFPNVESYIAKSMDGEIARDYEVLPQVRELLVDKDWNFTPEEKVLIQDEIDAIEKGLLP